MFRFFASSMTAKAVKSDKHDIRYKQINLSFFKYASH